MTVAFVRPPWWTPSDCYAVLVEPPTAEPITLAQAKLLAGVTWPDADPREPMLTTFIVAARSQVERDTGLALLTQKHHVELAVPATGTMMLPPQCSPVQTITEVAALTSDGRRMLMPAGRLLIRGASMTLTEWPTEIAAFDVVSGWPTPDDLQTHAPLLVHAVGLLTTHYATLGRDLASTTPATPVPMGYEDAIGPHRLIWVT